MAHRALLLLAGLALAAQARAASKIEAGVRALNLGTVVKLDPDGREVR